MLLASSARRKNSHRRVSSRVVAFLASVLPAIRLAYRSLTPALAFASLARSSAAGVVPAADEPLLQHK